MSETLIMGATTIIAALLQVILPKLLEDRNFSREIINYARTIFKCLLVLSSIGVVIALFTTFKETTASQINDKEKAYLKLLEETVTNLEKALTNVDRYEKPKELASNAEKIKRCMQNLGSLKSIKSVSLISRGLRIYYPEVDNGNRWLEKYSKVFSAVCDAGISALVEIKSSEACDILCELEINSVKYSERAKKAIEGVCNK